MLMSQQTRRALMLLRQYELVTMNLAMGKGNLLTIPKASVPWPGDMTDISDDCGMYVSAAQEQESCSLQCAGLEAVPRRLTQRGANQPQQSHLLPKPATSCQQRPSRHKSPGLQPQGSSEPSSRRSSRSAAGKRTAADMGQSDSDALTKRRQT